MRVYPKSGKKDDLFDRLKEYIDQFDQEWKNNILGTSDEKILELIKYSKVRECGFDLPDDYIIYLKRMGENDGNLLKYSISAETNINEVIDLYLYYEEDDNKCSGHGDGHLFCSFAVYAGFIYQSACKYAPGTVL